MTGHHFNYGTFPSKKLPKVESDALDPHVIQQPIEPVFGFRTFRVHRGEEPPQSGNLSRRQDHLTTSREVYDQTLRRALNAVVGSFVVQPGEPGDTGYKPGVLVIDGPVIGQGLG
jgi:hypothetical protein